jgi:hypothetical protein
MPKCLSTETLEEYATVAPHMFPAGAGMRDEVASMAKELLRARGELAKYKAAKAPKVSKHLGNFGETLRGFSILRFQDRYRQECSLQASSLIDNYPDADERPGSSAVWLSVDKGLPGDQRDKNGALIPWDGKMTPSHARMHLNREQVATLVEFLGVWLKTGVIKPKE